MKRICPLLAALALLLCAGPALAAPYTVDPAQSELSFSGEYAGTPFTGTFGAWTATVDFDADNLSSSRIAADIDLASASTGNKMFDETLPGADWLDVENHPHATFTSTALHRNGDGSYQADGDLQIRGVTRPVSFAFTLDDPKAGTVNATAALPLARLAFDIGRKSDDKGEWVGLTVTVGIKLHAVKSGG